QQEQTGGKKAQRSRLERWYIANNQSDRKPRAAPDQAKRNIAEQLTASERCALRELFGHGTISLSDTQTPRVHHVPAKRKGTVARAPQTILYKALLRTGSVARHLAGGHILG